MRTSSSIISVDRQPARGVDDHQVAAGAAGLLDAVARDRHGVRRALLAVHRDADLGAEHRELLGGRRAVDVAGHQQRGPALRVEVARELGRAGRLAGSLQPGHQHDRRRTRCERQGDVGLAHQGGELVRDDLHDLLVRRQGLHHLGAPRPLADRRGELLHHGQGDVRLEQGEADRPHRGVDVGRGELAPAPQAGEDTLQFLGERVEHRQPVTLA
jgi:hypothetical protein